MPPLEIFGQGKREPPEPPRPVAVTFWTPEEEKVLGRQFFMKYLVLTNRLGRGDMEADPKEGRR
jgi:hypothetical protein